MPLFVFDFRMEQEILIGILKCKVSFWEAFPWAIS